MCALLGATCFSLYEVFHRACTDSAAVFFATPSPYAKHGIEWI